MEQMVDLQLVALLVVLVQIILVVGVVVEITKALEVQVDLVLFTSNIRRMILLSAI
jgi:hypothetical protein